MRENDTALSEGGDNKITIRRSRHHYSMDKRITAIITTSDARMHL